MERPARGALALAILAGLANAVVVGALYERYDYPLLESGGDAAVVAATAFAVGFVPVVLSSHTRLLAPALGFVGAFAGTVALEVTSPAPRWGELGGQPVLVEGSTYVSSYASAWFLWLALFVLAGVLEFAIRRGYGLGDGRLRNLPDLPLGWWTLARAVAWIAGGFGVAVALLALREGSPPLEGLAILLAAAAVAAVPVAAVLSRGLVVPAALFALWVPYVLVLDVFVTLDSPVHLYLFAPYALVLALAGALEDRLRRRRFGWDGGRFADRPFGGR